jgi:hypothetical protein
MNIASIVFVITGFILPIAVSSRAPQAKKTPPKFYVDKGACPGEGCRYGGTAKVRKTTIAYARPDTRSPQIGRFMAGSEVVSLTGEVHTIPSRFVVKKAHEKYQPGDILWVYTYLGEGYFKVWFGGKMYSESLLFSPYGGGPGKRCEDSPDCWGELDQNLKMSWWIKIKGKDGLVGWTKQRENFIGIGGS